MPSVFLVGIDNQLTKMNQIDFPLESDLQRLIADHSALLGGCTSENEGSECKLLLIKREMGVPDQEAGNDRWSMDHFFVDQTGVPTLVEVKRSRNGQLRREVIGQLLDYAANGSAYWSIADIRARFQQQWGIDQAQEEMANFLGEQFASEDDFWREVELNLSRGHIRLVFVAEKLPPQLKRVIEFLNEQMKEVEVLGIELQHFTEGGQRAIAPSVVGRTSLADINKGRAQTLGRNYEALDKVVNEYRQITGNSPAVDNRTGHYRQIHLGHNIRRSFHYEFVFLARRGFSCEFHAEATERGDFDQALQLVAQSVGAINGIRLEYVQKPNTSALRVMPAAQQNAESIARTMVDLINATRERIEQAIRALQT